MVVVGRKEGRERVHDEREEGDDLVNVNEKAAITLRFDF